MKLRFLLLAFLFLLPGTASATVSCTIPINLRNGTTADAVQVMANFNAVATCFGSAASAGANTDITSLSGATLNNITFGSNPPIFTIPSLAAGVALNGSELFAMYQGAYPYNSVSSSVMKQYFANTGCTTSGGALFNSGSNTTQCSSGFTFGTTSFTSPDGNTWTSTGLANNGNGLTLTNIGSAAFVPYLFLRTPNLTAGQVGFIEVGHDESNANVVQWQFGFVGSGSNSNYLCTQFWGGVCLFKITAGGVITAGGALLSTTASGGIGYQTGVGAGGAVTQLTSRTTGVTLNNITGAITLFSAVGSATAATFTVTDSSVAATDTIIVNQKSGTNLYEIFVTAIAAGSFNITFLTTGGTATDAPVFNFAVIKGSAN